MVNKMKNKGSCLCGNITFSADSLLPMIGHCHCTMCQKFHGAAFSTFVEVKVFDLHWHQGEELLKSYHADNGTVRKFCQNCGSSLTFESKHNRSEKTIEIALSAFDEIEHVEPNAHIYTESKVGWLSLSDELPQYLAYRE